MEILSSSLNTMMTVDKHCCDICCDEFLVPKIDRKSKHVKSSDMKNFVCNQYAEKLAILNTENIEICRWITKVRW